jgi:hypothetical protein
MDLGGQSKGKEPRRVHAYIPAPYPKEKGFEIAPRKGFENHQKEQTGTIHPSLVEPRRIIYTSQRGSYKV